jgi:hypothetical protein
LPLVIRNVPAIKMVDRIPDQILTVTGVPNRLENRPHALGPSPASEAMAIARSDPINHTTPPAIREKTTASPTIPLRMLAPVSPKALLTTAL